MAVALHDWRGGGYESEGLYPPHTHRVVWMSAVVMMMVVVVGVLPIIAFDCLVLPRA